MKKKSLSVVIVSYNTRQLLNDCLKSVFKSLKGGSLGVEVIVVDNASSDDSVAMVKKNWPQVKLITNRRNQGFARANNQGIKIARGQYVLLLNSDTIVHRQALEKLVNFLEKRSQVGVVGPKLLNSDGSDQPSAGKFPTLAVAAVMLFKEHFQPSVQVRASFSQVKEVDWVMGAAFLVRKKILDQVGLLDEKIFMYMEEVELCYRIKKAGWEVFFYPEAKITHLGRASSETGKTGPILNIYKGLLYFYKKHRSLGEFWLIRLMLKIKAALAYLAGLFTNNNYLKKTYGQAWQIS